MDRSDERRRKRRILAEIAPRLRAFYQFLLDNSVERARDVLDRAMQQTDAAARGENFPSPRCPSCG
jgi:hypothetical protein